jgi:hypothetical protein
MVERSLTPFAFFNGCTQFFYRVMNTRYWVELSPVGQNTAEWAFAGGLSDPGVAGEFFYANGAVHPNGSPYLMQVTATAVPEPSSYLLVALAALGWGCSCRLCGPAVKLPGVRHSEPNKPRTAFTLRLWAA